ncbi:hypothetical protein NSK_002442 [Nannochloropsis salina CCMP1776]|uniref:J domain-containing protein n=1 Tax=Nannochloropsis salina CCMP1776 TaxID=1027361 RepID=A0A4D9D5G5_9STRA|nr:hypothetical protein NSK_002442 [Nannochloropsis salina CCMP1776]|eukprot:TFJ86234.1 hypothetical protein NSK_002442 [Nannochloropsis salina CCMP1776]
MGALEAMTTPQAQVAKAFGEKKTLYEILGVAKDAASAVIRKAYFKMALTCHPDKCPEDPEATARFQALSIVHATLSDTNKRRNYDETGEIGSEDAELNQSEQEWYEYWRALFPTVTVEKINRFQEEYRESEEEARDVLRAYEEAQGKMSLVIDNVMLATDGDEGRFRKMIEEAITNKRVKRFKCFKADVRKDLKRKKRAEKEAKEAEELLEAIQARRGPDALATMGRDRQQQMSSFLQSLEEKYGKGKKVGGSGCKEAGGKGRKRDREAREGARGSQRTEDIDDADFERLRDSLSKKKVEERRD